MPIVRYIGAVDTALRSFGKKVEVKPGQFVDVTKPEAEALRSSVYRKHFEGNEETLVREFASDEVTGAVASGREGVKKEEVPELTKREMLDALVALGVEITPQVKKYNSAELSEFLNASRKEAQFAEASSDEVTGTDETVNAPAGDENGETEVNATESGDGSSDEPNVAEGAENATTGTQDAPEAGAEEILPQNTEA